MAGVNLRSMTSTLLCRHCVKAGTQQTGGVAHVHGAYQANEAGLNLHMYTFCLTLPVLSLQQSTAGTDGARTVRARRSARLQQAERRCSWP